MFEDSMWCVNRRTVNVIAKMIKLHMFFWKAIFSLLCMITMDHTSTSLLFLWSEEKGLELWWLTPIFQQYFSYILAVSFIGERNRSTRRKPLTDKLSHIKYTSPSSGIKLTTLVVICSDCTSSCRASYQTIMITTICVWIVCKLFWFRFTVLF